MNADLQKAMQDDYGVYALKETKSVAFKVMPDIDSLICGAVALLEMALHVAPCNGPGQRLHEAIESCKKAFLYDYDNLPIETEEVTK